MSLTGLAISFLYRFAIVTFITAMSLLYLISSRLFLLWKDVGVFFVVCFVFVLSVKISPLLPFILLKWCHTILCMLSYLSIPRINSI